MPSIVDIVNRALDYLGQQPIVSMDEAGPNATRIRRIWPQCRDSVLREHIWKCATHRTRLVELGNRPAFGYARRYQLPPDFLRLVDTDPEMAEVTVEGDSLLCNEKRLAIAYVARVENPRFFDASLAEVLSLKLASELAFGTSASMTLARQMEEKYQMRLREAKGFDAREGGVRRPEMGLWAQARLGR